MSNENVIVVPVDGSDCALQAVKYAATQAKAFNDKIVLLNVQPKVNNSLYELVSEEQILLAQQETAEEIFNEACSILDLASIEYEKKIRTGLPSIEISAEAKEIQARSIIMGTRGMGPVMGKALGSVSYSLTHLSPCPLTLVPAAIDI